MIKEFRFPKVKVCGLSSLDDVAAVAESGADAAGFVQQPESPRAVSAYYVNRMVGNLPDCVLPVGVFVDQDPKTVLRWCRQGGSRAAQLCGSERPADWKGFALPLLRRVAVAEGAEAEVEAWRQVAAGFVLDHPDAPGGTGRPVDLELAARLCELAPCLLAGGLDEHNVAEAVTSVRPHGVDASSRLEVRPGIKDPARIRAFVEAAREALEGIHA